MAQVARFRKQRPVKRNPWKTRFTKQRANNRGSSNPSVLLTPTLASIAPTTNTAAGTAFTVTCTGTNYASGVTVATVGGVDHATTFVSATSVTFSFPRPGVIGSYSVNVRNGSAFSTTPKTLTLT